MHREGHVGAALLVYAPLAFIATAAGADELALIGAVTAAALSMAPDVDLRLPGVPHRGPTHTVWFAAAVGIATGLAGALIGAGDGLLEAALLGAFAFLVGAGSVVSHLAADALTPAGVRPFAPRNDRKYTYSVVRAANPLANYALLAIGFLAAAGAVGLATRLTAAIGF